MEFKNPFKKIKNRFQKSKKLQRQTELQIKYLAYQKPLKHLRELQATYSLNPTNDLALELQQLDKKVVELNMEYIEFYEDKRKKALSGFQKELDKVAVDD